MSRLDHVKKLEQLGMDHWMSIGKMLGDVDVVKALLREQAKVEVTITRRLTALKEGTAIPARTKEFVSKTYFKKKGVWMASDFKNLVFVHAKTVASVPEMPVAFCDLERPANDAEIQAELPENHIFDGVDTLLPFLAGQMDRQPGGKAGDLLNNAYANIFYVRVGLEVFAVRVRWYSDRGRWFVLASRLDGARWVAGIRVFPATAVA